MPALLQATSAEIAVISAGNSDRYPDPTMLARVMDLAVYRTDVEGAVHVVSDGQMVQVIFILNRRKASFYLPS